MILKCLSLATLSGESSTYTAATFWTFPQVTDADILTLFYSCGAGGEGGEWGS